MIYKIYLIDGDNGIAVLDTTFKEFIEVEEESVVFPDLFNAVNIMIDNIHKDIARGKNLNELMKTIETESTLIVLFYHPLSRMLICSISDVEDNIEKIKDVIKKIGSRLWLKHQSEIELYRSTTDKSRIQIFTADIEIMTLGGKIAEDYPKLIVIKNILQKIRSMGIINDFDYLVAINCNGKSSPLEISRKFEKSMREIHDVLDKLESLVLIKR